MEMHWIEVDDKIWKYLQVNAEPFIDNPNSVLHRILFGESVGQNLVVGPPISVTGLPKALAQILEVIHEVERHGFSRAKATRRVAEKRGTVPQTIMDKYCKQLGKKARDIDVLLEEPGYVQFKGVLKDKFPDHNGIIDIFFETMLMNNH